MVGPFPGCCAPRAFHCTKGSGLFLAFPPFPHYPFYDGQLLSCFHVTFYTPPHNNYYKAFNLHSLSPLALQPPHDHYLPFCLCFVLVLDSRPPLLPCVKSLVFPIFHLCSHATMYNPLCPLFLFLPAPPPPFGPLGSVIKTLGVAVPGPPLPPPFPPFLLPLY